MRQEFPEPPSAFVGLDVPLQRRIAISLHPSRLGLECIQALSRFLRKTSKMRVASIEFVGHFDEVGPAMASGVIDSPRRDRQIELLAKLEYRWWDYRPAFLSAVWTRVVYDPVPIR